MPFEQPKNERIEGSESEAYEACRLQFRAMLDGLRALKNSKSGEVEEVAEKLRLAFRTTTETMMNIMRELGESEREALRLQFRSVVDAFREANIQLPDWPREVARQYFRASVDALRKNITRQQTPKDSDSKKL